MAGCDNLYGNRKQWKELYDFLEKNSPEDLVYMKEDPKENSPEDFNEDDEFRLCYIAEIQEWLINNCKLDWVIEQLNDNFEVQRFICGKAHHEEF